MTTELILLCMVSLASGFIDAIVGGGGLVQTPAARLPTVFGIRHLLDKQQVPVARVSQVIKA